MSKAKIRNADYSITQIVKKSAYRSYASKNDMQVMLKKCVRDLHELGYKVCHVKGFKAKHVYKLVDYWKEQNKSAGTIKNYLCKLRELGRLLGDSSLVKPDNTPYNVDGRKYIPTENKAIHDVDFSKCNDKLIRLSMEGQYLFGLRREESIKFILSDAIQRNNYITLSPSWTKGGIGREVPITSLAQREWLMRVDEAVNPGQSLIAEGCSYKDQLNKYAFQTRRMRLRKLHGLRHAYAQRRYRELTKYFDPNNQGWECPFNGGKTVDLMTNQESSIDFKVRSILTRELGHSRLNILKSYLK